MVVGGIDGNTKSETDSVEVISLSPANVTCEDNWPFPTLMANGVGGFFNGDTPIVCTVE